MGARLSRPEWRNPDDLAGYLLGEQEKELIAGDPVADAFASDDPEAQRNPRVLGITLTMVIRTKYIDERLERAVVDGATQVVILGAGWDTRAYRKAELLKGVQVFEVDRPTMQQWKRRRAELALGVKPENLTYLQIDFTHQKLADVLGASSYDPAKKTFFIWEGVTMYLPEQAVRETLQWISKQAPGSSVVFDFADQEIIGFMSRVSSGQEPSNTESRIAAERGQQLDKWGEPWIFGIPAGESEEFVKSVGLKHRDTLAFASPAAAQRYLGWHTGETFPAPVRQLYLITEAIVLD